MPSMPIGLDSRTIHTLRVTLEDNLISQLDAGDEVEVILCSRYGDTRPKRLSYADLQRLLSEKLPLSLRPKKVL